jgi:hypothetical protein
LDEASGAGNFDAAARTGASTLLPEGEADWRGEVGRRLIEVFIFFFE